MRGKDRCLMLQELSGREAKKEKKEVVSARYIIAKIEGKNRKEGDRIKGGMKKEKGKEGNLRIESCLMQYVFMLKRLKQINQNEIYARSICKSKDYVMAPTCGSRSDHPMNRIFLEHDN